MESLPIIAGLMTAVSALMLALSLIAYRRTGMRRVLSISAISCIMMLKGIFLFMDMIDMISFTYEIWAGMDLIMAVFLALMLFGKE